MPDDYITAGEFGRFTEALDGRLTELRTDIREGFANLNGRTRAQAEAIVALDTQVKGIAARGCGRYEAHKELLENLPTIAMKKTWRDWHPAAKAGAGVGVGAVMIAVLQFISKLVEHLWK